VYSADVSYVVRHTDERGGSFPRSVRTRPII